MKKLRTLSKILLWFFWGFFWHIHVVFLLSKSTDFLPAPLLCCADANKLFSG